MPKRSSIMDRHSIEILFRRVLVGMLLVVLLYFNMPGCKDRRFPPIRDPNDYLLEVYQIEVSEHVGRNHPPIEDVVKARRTKIVTRFPVLRLSPGGHAESESTLGGADRIHVQLKTVQNRLAVLRLGLYSGLSTRPDSQSSPVINLALQETIKLPPDTWGTSVIRLNSERHTLDLLVYRLNSPA